ncbi:MAG: nucleoside transporter C-terminal domain-containing protein [Acidobacteriota bacterium]
MYLQSLLGILVILAIAWLSSEHRRKINWRLVSTGLALQALIALLLLKVPLSQRVFLMLNRVIMALDASTQAGTSFVFGYLGGGEPPFEVTSPSSLMILAFRGLPVLLVISALSSLLFYWKVLPAVVKGFSALLQKSLRIGGAEGLGVGGNIFMGMVEAPLLIRPYVVSLTRSELFTIMTCGMATIAGTVMVLYAHILSDVIPNSLGNILTASVMNAPAAIVISKLLIPETAPLTPAEIVDPEPAHNSMDAITRGTIRGVQLLINIVAMLLVLVALVYLVNLILGLLPWSGTTPLTLQWLLGTVLAPFTWLLGIPWSEAVTAGRLLGTKTILNELVAYLDMSRLPAGALGTRSLVIMTYALCGFANPGSLGIMIGGLGTMAPSRRGEIVELGLRSILAGTLSTCLTGALVGVIL